jgi:hypothetical protein
VPDEIAFIGIFGLAVLLLFVSGFYQTANGGFARTVLFSLGRAIVDVFGLPDRRVFIFPHQAAI